MAQRLTRRRFENIAAFGGDRRGSFATMSAIIAPLALALTAFAVDEGALYTEKRNLQSLTDIAAITAAANLTNASNAAVVTVQDNKTSDITVSAPGDTYDPKTNSTARVNVIVERGRYTKSTAVIANRFQPNVQPYNSVRVTLRKGGDLYFARPFMDTPLIETTAVAHVPAEAAFSIGSRLASLNGGILNSVLSSLLGTSVSLSAMGYDALATVDVNALDFLGALATQLNLQAGTYDDVLNSNVTIGQIASALASISGSNQSAQLALQTLVSSNPTNIAIPLRHLIDLGSVGALGIGEKPTGLSVVANAMDILMASTAIASGGKQVSVGLNASAFGLAGLSLDVSIGEPPQHSPFLAVGETGTIVRTAQTRIKLVATVATPALLSALLDAQVKLPLFVNVAYAEAKLTDISCPTGRPDSLNVKIDARPGIFGAYIGDPAAFTDYSVKPAVSPAEITKLKALGLTVANVYGSAKTEVENTSYTSLTFNKAEIDAKSIKKVSTRNITQPLVQSLVDNLELTVVALGIKVLGIPVAIPLLPVSTIIGVLSPVTTGLDTILFNTLTALGVKVGEADIRVTGATCGRSVLVQ